MNAQSSCGETLTRQEKQRVPPLSPSTVYFSIAGSFSPQQVTFPRFSFCVARKKQECYSPIVASRSLGRGSSALGWEGFLESAQPPVSQGHLRSAVILGLVGVLFEADKSQDWRKPVFALVLSPSWAGDTEHRPWFQLVKSSTQSN